VSRWLLVAPLLALYACGAKPPADMSPRDRAQWIGSATAEVVDAYDVQLARIYTDETDRCREQSEGWPDYDACVDPVEMAQRALQEARATLLTYQDALDSSRYGDDLYRMAQCIGDSLARLTLALERFGVTPPPLVATIVDAADTYTGGCRAPAGTAGGSTP